MNEATRNARPQPPDDKYGRRLLTIVGFFVIVAGVALIWKDSGTGSVAAGISVIAIGAAMTFAAAFHPDARGTVRLGDSELRFGRDPGTNATAVNPRKRRQRRWWWSRDS